MARLAIKGHPARGEEVIQILEMLGGINKEEHNGENNRLWYNIDERNEINFFTHAFDLNDYFFFTIEEFLEKFPYKVGDKVYYDNKVCDVIEMLWNSNLNTISYGVCDGKMKNLAIVEELKPYKEETMEETKKDLDWHPTDYLEFENNNDTWADEVEVNLGNDYEIQVRDGKTFIVRKKPQYPKTYEECCDVLKIPNDERYIDIDVPLDYNKLLHAFTELLICRDAYWKIAGEEMGLDKPWQPDYTNPDIDLYVIITIYNRLKKAKYGYGFQHCILTFPTEEMRDAFYKNFKDLIKECKELL